ncbi:MAG: LPS export ABC transporter periplasmic protein LptC [Desulfobacterales bacterium]|nr:LPS export ABC transporter periplasmic protein LptC [Desulfobacterales bacterium]
MTPPAAMARSTRIRRIVISMAILIMVAIVAVFVQYRRLAPSPEALVAALPETTNFSLGQVTHSATRDGRTEWRLKATAARLKDGKKRLELDSPDVVYFMEDGREIYMKAQRGTLDTTANDMAASGQVQVEDGRYRLETEALNYDHGRRIITCPVPVRLFDGQSEATGDRMIYDMNTKRIELKGHVDVHFSQNGLI